MGHTAVWRQVSTYIMSRFSRSGNLCVEYIGVLERCVSSTVDCFLSSTLDACGRMMVYIFKHSNTNCSLYLSTYIHRTIVASAMDIHPPAKSTNRPHSHCRSCRPRDTSYYCCSLCFCACSPPKGLRKTITTLVHTYVLLTTVCVDTHTPALALLQCG